MFPGQLIPVFCIFALVFVRLLHPFVIGLFSRTTWISQYQKGKTSLDYNEARDDGVWVCSGISCTYAISLHLSPDITTPTPYHSIFTCRMLFLTPSQQQWSVVGRKYSVHSSENGLDLFSKAKDMYNCTCSYL